MTIAVDWVIKHQTKPRNQELMIIIWAIIQKDLILLKDQAPDKGE